MTDLGDFSGGADAASSDDSDSGFQTPVCCVDGCDTEVPGVFDGWDAHNREGVACNDCRDYYDRHNHWPDEDPDRCVECLIDDGAVRHECDEAPFDAVILEPGSKCDHCSYEPETAENTTHD